MFFMLSVSALKNVKSLKQCCSAPVISGCWTREDPVPPIILFDKVLEAPASILTECPACKQWVRGPAVGLVFVEFCWISSLSNWVRVENYSLVGSKLVLILASFNSSGNRLVRPSIFSVPRVADASMVFSVFTDIFGRNLWLQILLLLKFLQLGERLMKLLNVHETSKIAHHFLQHSSRCFCLCFLYLSVGTSYQGSQICYVFEIRYISKTRTIVIQIQYIFCCV